MSWRSSEEDWSWCGCHSKSGTSAQTAQARGRVWGSTAPGTGPRGDDPTSSCAIALARSTALTGRRNRMTGPCGGRHAVGHMANATFTASARRRMGRTSARGASLRAGNRPRPRPSVRTRPPRTLPPPAHRAEGGGRSKRVLIRKFGLCISAARMQAAPSSPVPPPWLPGPVPVQLPPTLASTRSKRTARLSGHTTFRSWASCRYTGQRL